MDRAPHRWALKLAGRCLVEEVAGGTGMAIALLRIGMDPFAIAMGPDPEPGSPDDPGAPSDIGDREGRPPVTTDDMGTLKTPSRPPVTAWGPLPALRGEGRWKGWAERRVRALWYPISRGERKGQGRVLTSWPSQQGR